MNLNQLLPLAVICLLVLAVLGLLVGVGLFVTLSRQFRKLAAQNAETSEALERLTRSISVLEDFSPQLLNTRLAELESRKPITVPEPSSPAFVGASRRGQVLRLHRNGESPVNIAETLGVSQGEVNLTLKLQDLFSQTVP